MNNKMAIISQLSTIEKNQTKQTNRTGTESQKWRSHGGWVYEQGSGRGREGGRYRE